MTRLIIPMRQGGSLIGGIGVAGLLVVAAGLATLSGTGTTALAHAPARPSKAIVIKNYLFHPTTITVKRGTSIVWTNKDSDPHTVTGNSSSLHLSSGGLGKGKSFNFVVKRTGTFTYHCAYHSFMHGTVRVVAS